MYIYMYIYMCVRVRVCILWGPRELWGLFAGPHKYFALYHDNSLNIYFKPGPADFAGIFNTLCTISKRQFKEYEV